MEIELDKYNVVTNDINDELVIIVQILTIYNCRISEILRMKSSDIINGKFAILKGSKNSSDVIIRDRLLLKLIEELKAKRNDKMFIYTNYYGAYRFIKKNYQHLIQKIKKRKNNKVTHLFRYFAVCGVDDNKTVKAILHHNSVKSNKYYTNKIKGNSNGNN